METVNEDILAAMRRAKWHASFVEACHQNGCSDCKAAASTVQSILTEAIEKLEEAATLTAIPADPWPADAIEVWRVKRGEEVLHVWKLPPDSNRYGPWICESGDGYWPQAISALPAQWFDDAQNLVWERVK